MKEKEIVYVGRDDYRSMEDNTKMFYCPNCKNKSPLGECPGCGVVLKWSTGRGLYSRETLADAGLGFYGPNGKKRYY